MVLLANLQAPVELPTVRREFRAAWVATVDNIDWPSSRGLSTARQQAELLRILDRAAALKLNAIVLQVRTSADALYPSPFEPWSEYLTGKQGRPPRPFYDPLEFAVREAHHRGLELHCWLNPYRAKHPSAKLPLAPSHIARTNPGLVYKFGPYLWMDPGQPQVQRRSMKVIADLVKRYDIDGVHIDDYFYPYPEGSAVFPDAATYRKYGNGLSLGDWRRKNVDDFVKSADREIHRIKPWVKFGISPFGIYRPGVPPSIKAGIDQYATLYADPLKWLRQGWCDYLTPQLYWPIAQTPQSYPVLLQWWVSQNAKNRHIWPGLFTSKTIPGAASQSYSASEVVNQIRVTRLTPGATGHVHFSMKALNENGAGVTDALRGSVYTDWALPPATSWLRTDPVAAPHVTSEGGTWKWQTSDGGQPFWYVVWMRYGKSKWVTRVLPGYQDEITPVPSLAIGNLTYGAVAAVDRLGKISSPTVISID